MLELACFGLGSAVVQRYFPCDLNAILWLLLGACFSKGFSFGTEQGLLDVGIRGYFERVHVCYRPFDSPFEQTLM